MKLTQHEIAVELGRLGVTSGMELEVHSSLSSFGYVEGGALAVIAALKEAVGPNGSIFMPALRLSKNLPLTAEDKALGITTKIKKLSEDYGHSGMGAIADTFLRLEDTYKDGRVFGTAAWGRSAAKVMDGGLRYLLGNGGKALLMGVDIYKLTAMHCVEGILPRRIRDIFKPSEEIDMLYPPEEWFIETGTPPVKAWYTIQNMAYEKGVIRDGVIGSCKIMFFDIWDVVGIYENELKRDPYGLYGVERPKVCGGKEINQL